MDETTRRLVRERAADTCEYCGLKQQEQPAFRLHIEHIIAQKHGGTDELENLALACRHCNLHKSSNLSGIDKETGEMVRLLHPRQDVWSEHFTRDEARIVGLTGIGRTTVAVLGMNKPARVRLRRQARRGD